MKPIEWSRLFSLRNVVVVTLAIGAFAVFGVVNFLNDGTGYGWTPLVLSISSALLVFFTKDLRPLEKSLSVLIVFILVDVALAFIGPGIRDRLGQSITAFILLLCIMVPVIFLGISNGRDTLATVRQKVQAVAVLLGGFVVYLIVTRWLNMGVTVAY